MSITLNDVFNDEYDFDIPLFPCISIWHRDIPQQSYSIGRQEEELVERLNEIINDPEEADLMDDDEVIVYYEHDDDNRYELFKWIIGKGKEGIKQENEEVKNEESDEESDDESDEEDKIICIEGSNDLIVEKDGKIYMHLDPNADKYGMIVKDEESDEESM